LVTRSGRLVALGVAAEHPDKVRAVVLLDPPGAGFLTAHRRDALRRHLGRHPRRCQERRVGRRHHAKPRRRRVPHPTQPGQSIPYSSTRDAAALRFVARCVADLDPATLNPALEGGWLGGFDLGPQLAHVRCPVLLVVGDPKVGGMLPPADADPLAAALATAPAWTSPASVTCRTSRTLGRR